MPYRTPAERDDRAEVEDAQEIESFARARRRGRLRIKLGLSALVVGVAALAVMAGTRPRSAALHCWVEVQRKGSPEMPQSTWRVCAWR